MNNEVKEEEKIVEQNTVVEPKPVSNSPLTEKDNGGSPKVGIIIALIIFVAAGVGFIFYNKSNKEEKPTVTPSPTPSAKPVIVDDKITSLNKVVVSDTDQTENVGGNEFKIKKEITVDGAFLIINGDAPELKDNETVYADYAYVTNKFIMFTQIGQDGELITYAIDKDGKQITVDDSKYQMHDIKLVDGNISASGHIFCGLDGDCPDKTLSIKYENNTIKVAPVE